MFALHVMHYLYAAEDSCITYTHFKINHIQKYHNLPGSCIAGKCHITPQKLLN